MGLTGARSGAALANVCVGAESSAGLSTGSRSANLFRFSSLFPPTDSVFSEFFDSLVDDFANTVGASTLFVATGAGRDSKGGASPNVVDDELSASEPENLM